MKEPVSRNEVNKEAFGRRLTQAMEERRETTYSMADSVSLTASTISRYANGKMAPKIPTLFQLADHLQVNPLWLMGYDRPREQARSAGGRIPVVQAPGALPEPDAGGKRTAALFRPAFAGGLLLLLGGRQYERRADTGGRLCICKKTERRGGRRDCRCGHRPARSACGAVYKAGGRTIMKTEPVRMETTPDSAPIIGKVVAFQGLAR